MKEQYAQRFATFFGQNKIQLLSVGCTLILWLIVHIQSRDAQHYWHNIGL